MKVLVSGSSGLVGSALTRGLQRRGYRNLLLHSHSELDLCNQKAVADFFRTERPDQVFLAAAKVGGILANDTYPAEFAHQNLLIQTNVIHEAMEWNEQRRTGSSPHRRWCGWGGRRWQHHSPLC